MKPPWAVELEIFAMISSSRRSGVTVPGTSGSARNPSSVISLTKALGVHNERTLLRETLGRKVTAWVTSYSRLRPAALQILPSRALTTMVRRFAPIRSLRYASKVSTYSWPMGSCFSKPASMRNCTANQAMPRVKRARTASTSRRCPNKMSSMRGRTPRTGVSDSFTELFTTGLTGCAKPRHQRSRGHATAGRRGSRHP
ncbi:hypothetical protein FQZ97_759930 [compost metagenome]